MATYTFDSRNGRFAHESAADPLHRVRRRPLARIALRAVQLLFVAGAFVIGLFALAVTVGIALVAGAAFAWRMRKARRQSVDAGARETSGNSFIVRREF